MKGNISRNEYLAIHAWLRRNYGKADHCENPDCKGNSDLFDRCLKKGFYHERNIDNYIQLCKKCHALYDGKAERMRGNKLAEGRYWGKEEKHKRGRSLLGNKNGFIQCISFERKICEYCNTEVSINTYKRSHGRNCKYKDEKN